MASVSPVINTWSGGAGDDVAIVDSIFHSEPNCVSFFTESANGGPGDIIVPLDYSDMGYVVSFYMYVEEGTGAYFNIQTDVTPGVGWAYDVFFGADGSIDYQIAQISQGSGSYTNGEWFLIENDIDLINDIATISVDGVEQIELPFISDLGSVNFFPLSNEPTAHYYIDDIEVNMYDPTSVYEREIEAAIYPNPAKESFNISGVANSSQITVQDLLGKTVYTTSSTELVTTIQTNEWERGYYFVTISNNLGTLTRKVIVE